MRSDLELLRAVVDIEACKPSTGRTIIWQRK